MMSYPIVGGATSIAAGVTTVDCQKQIRSWRLLRSLMELLIPRCNCAFIEEHEIKAENRLHEYHIPWATSISSTTTTITGTIYGYRRGKVSFCIQTNSKSTTTNNSPVLLLELAVPTTILAREMRGGLLRIALESTTYMTNNGPDFCSVLSMPSWTMYFNGRKVGFAVKRWPTKADVEVLQLMDSVVEGAGVISGKELSRDDDVMYLRGKFERVYGSSNSESFHLIDPDGSSGQQLSIFFLRSQ